ncbi:MAG: hypothetical protein V1816_01200 [Pseudomonadota bacterium]
MAKLVVGFNYNSSKHFNFTLAFLQYVGCATRAIFYYFPGLATVNWRRWPRLAGGAAPPLALSHQDCDLLFPVQLPTLATVTSLFNNLPLMKSFQVVSPMNGLSLSRSPVYNLGGGPRGDGEVKPVLNDPVETFGLLAVALVVAAALFKNIGGLLAGPALTCHNFIKFFR